MFYSYVHGRAKKLLMCLPPEKILISAKVRAFKGCISQVFRAGNRSTWSVAVSPEVTL